MLLARVRYRRLLSHHAPCTRFEPAEESGEGIVGVGGADADGGDILSHRRVRGFQSNVVIVSDTVT